jgi:hypothetical protein
MICWPNREQRKVYRQNAKSALFQTFVVLPTAVLGFGLLLGFTATLFGLPGDEFAHKFLSVAFSLEIWPESGGSRAIGYTWGQQA